MSAAEVSRRAFLTALGAGMGGAAWAKAPTVSLIPEPRPRAWPAPGDPPRPRDIVAEIALPGQTGYVVADAVTGEVLAAHAPDRTMSTASVAKFVTAQYALETFGPAHRFTTRILATSPIAGGRVDGDVILAGGADPMLDSDDLAAMVQTLAASGLKVISGRLLVHRGPVPLVRRIDASQPDHVSYNPGVSGLSLNFNRVYFEWKRDGDGYATRMDARGAAVQPQVGLTRMAVVDRASPVFAYQSRSGFEDWSVARGALGKDGARWLPVRNPALYAGHALAGLLAGAGITVAGGVPRVVDNLPATVELARHDSMTLDRIVRSMLYYSTNLIAEVIGMASSAARGSRAISCASSRTCGFSRKSSLCHASSRR